MPVTNPENTACELIGKKIIAAYNKIPKVDGPAVAHHSAEQGVKTKNLIVFNRKMGRTTVKNPTASPIAVSVVPHGT